jgi:hypothetical protein
MTSERAGRTGKAAEALREQAVEWAKEANQALNAAASAVGLGEKVEKNPYGLLGAALGVGYVLGGGLFTPTTGRLVRMGLKLARVPIVQDRLLEVAEAALDGILEKTRTRDSK